MKEMVILNDGSIDINSSKSTVPLVVEYECMCSTVKEWSSQSRFFEERRPQVFLCNYKTNLEPFLNGKVVKECLFNPSIKINK